MEMNRTTVDDLNAQGEAALSAGDWAAAAAAYEALVEILPQEAELKYKLARAYEQLGRTEDVAEVLSSSGVAGLPQAKRMLASAYMTAKDYAAALPLIDDLLLASPDDVKLNKWKDRCQEKLSSRHIAAALQQAKALASADRFEEAEQAYLGLLAQYPNASGGHGRLAQIYMHQKRWAEAIKPLRAGLAIDPDNAEMRISLARALFKNGDPAEAVSVLVSLDACQNDPAALFLLQRSYVELQDWERVEEAGARLLAILPPDDPLRPSVSGLAQDAAVERRSAALDVLVEAGADEKAILGYRDLVHRYPESPSAWLRLGTALANREHYPEALEALRKAVDLRPDDMDIRRGLTRVIVKTSDEQTVLEYVQEAVAAGRADVECYRWLGRRYADACDWDASLQSLRNALALEPQNPSVRVGLARALTKLGRFPEALDELDSLISSGAKAVEALQTKADIFVQLGRLDDATTLYELALVKAPKHPLISYKLSNAALLKGDIEGFHRRNDRRRELSSFIEGERERPFQDWEGQLSIEGKLLVWTESGFSVGENILHMSVLRLLTGLGLDIVLEVPPELAAICRRSFPYLTVAAAGTSLPPSISHHAPVGSLSRWFKPDLASFGSMQPYLLPDLNGAKAHRARLQRDQGAGSLLVGVCSAEIEETQFCDALALPGVTLVNLQRHDPLQPTGPVTAGPGERMIESGIGGDQDLDHLLSLLSAMDLVVCTDNVIAHLAGAAGIPAFVLLPAAPPAHWLGSGEGCIWYPNARLFRQSQIDRDWLAVLDQVGSSVGEYACRYEPASWLARTLVQGAEPPAAQKAALTPDEICDAVRSFVVQGPSAPTAYQSALELIDRLPADHLSKEMTLQRGDLLVRFGRWEEARTVYATLASSEVDDPHADARILSVSLAMHDLEYALSIARRLVDQDPTYRPVAANVLYHLRRRDEALEELRVASLQGVQPDRLGTLFGTLLLEKGDDRRAEAYLREQAAMTRQPDIHTLLARSVSAQGRREEALALFDRAVALAQDDPNANFWRTQERVHSGQASSVALPPLLGDLPRAAPDDVVIYFVADSSYFWQHGLVLLASLGRRSPGTKCHVHVINPDEGVAPAITAIREMLPGLTLSLSYEHNAFDGRSDEYVRTYYASVRFVRLAEIFARAPAIYLSLDADCIVRGDITAEGLGVGDVGARMRFDERPHATVAAGALRLRPTEGAARFVERIAMLIRSTLESGEAVWFLDQIVLSHALRELGDGAVTIDQLGMTYIDWFFQDESLIWTGKGPRKLADNRYTDELAKYRYIQESESISVLMPRNGDQSDEG